MCVDCNCEDILAENERLKQEIIFLKRRCEKLQKGVDKAINIIGSTQKSERCGK